MHNDIQVETLILPRLPSPPSMGDIHNLLSRALETRGQSYEICWTPLGNPNEHILMVEASPRGGDAQWRMHVGNVESEPLWNYVSCDVLLVYNLVVSSTGDLSRGVTGNDDYLSSSRAQTVSSENQLKQVPGGNILKRAVPPSARSSRALAGDLGHVQSSSLLQSIQMAKMGGLLVVESNMRRAEVFFVDGTPVHAVANETLGEESIYELLTWKDGSFHFEPHRTTEEKTIKQPLEGLLLQGMQLIDNAAYLRNLGLRPDSYLAKAHQNIAEQDFESRANSGSPLNMEKQKLFYQAIDESETVQNLLEKLHMPRSQWIMLMCNLLRTELIAILPPSASQKSAQPPLEPKRIDQNLIQSVMMALRSTETGMFTYPAFLYFLEQEYFRAYRSANPISVLLFQMRVQNPLVGPAREPLSNEALSAAVRRISRVKRHVDLLAHYETNDYALLLPNTKAGGALIFANRIVRALMSEPLVADKVDANNLKLAIGIASIPEDFLELSHVLSAAEVAKNASIFTETPVVSYKDIKE